MSIKTGPTLEAPCRFCGRTDYPHECIDLPTVLNSRLYCPDGERHGPVDMRGWWRWKRAVCGRCGEQVATHLYSATEQPLAASEE